MDYAFYGCSNLASVDLDGVQTIGDRAFSGCSALKDFILPESLTQIGDYAFHNTLGPCVLNIPDSVVNIGTYAFSRMRQLVEVSMPVTVVTLPGYVFDSCPFLAEVELRGAFDVPTSWDANWLGWNDDVSLVFTGESGE